MNAHVTLQTRRTPDGVERVWRVNGRAFESGDELEEAGLNA
ncbi:hypothetical protein Htur_5285 (plasmid) [Haloterrigena turkmenica DSM 5511]|uniref:Uncharacterized protein n=1 Tax=Haloterrigena turkmenica (strain ATCC 51198 / DSM 5511 / JCM 9101 / NCIMB 13204 / VKM B-1734 / 4k) TaxID=543526 RepID=D2S3R5_HALTV|nr:hypothetical protein [Haloterrigena turkmenica]ADB64012.1 hypothetical protein Htur_5285 [Haloterrigena turkmenica DSM 5511]